MKRVTVTGFFLTAVISFSYAQMDKVLLEMGADAVKGDGGYISPFMNTMGTGMLNGWHNSSKSISFFGLPLGFSVGTMSFTAGKITEDMKTFDFEGDIPFRPMLNLLNPSLPDTVLQEFPETIRIVKDDVPTIYGSRNPDSISLGELARNDPSVTQEAYDLLFKEKDTLGVTVPAQLDSNLSFPLPFRGLVPGEYWGTLPNITAVTAGLKKIPVFDNIQVGISYVPSIEQKIKGVGDLKFDFLSYKIQHEFTHYLPFLEKLKILHGSVYWAQNSMNLKAGNASMEMNNWVAMTNASIDLKLLFFGVGAFAGIGYESSSMSLEVASSGDFNGIPRIEIPADRTTRYQLGVRASVLIFDVWGEFNMGQVNSYSLGFTVLAFNGL